MLFKVKVYQQGSGLTSTIPHQISSVASYQLNTGTCHFNQWRMASVALFSLSGFFVFNRNDLPFEIFHFFSDIMPLIKVKWVWARMGGWKYMMSKRPYEEKEKCIFIQFYLNGVCFDLTLNQGECCINSKIPDFDICIACLRFLKRLGYFQLRRTFRKTFEISKKNPPKNPENFWEKKHGHHFQRSLPRHQLTNGCQGFLTAMFFMVT